MLFQQIQGSADAARKGGARQQFVEGDDQFLNINHAGMQSCQVAVLLDLCDVAQRRVARAERLAHGEAAQLVGFQVNQVHILLGITANGAHIGGWMQGRMAERHQARVIVGDLVNRTSA